YRHFSFPPTQTRSRTQPTPSPGRFIRKDLQDVFLRIAEIERLPSPLPSDFVDDVDALRHQGFLCLFITRSLYFEGEVLIAAAVMRRRRCFCSRLLRIEEQ